MIVGIDDTDTPDSRGTNQLARQIVRAIAPEWRCVRIVRHQLLYDPRVPYTSKNGSASISLVWKRGLESWNESVDAEAAESLLHAVRGIMREEFIEGSDPGLCLLNGECPVEVIDWGLKCQHELVNQHEARQVARQAKVHLESLGGSEDGVIGALAAVGLASKQNDGRIIQLGEWPDDLSGLQDVSVLSERGVEVREHLSGKAVTNCNIDIGKHLRPNLRQGCAVVFAERLEANEPSIYRAIKLV